MYPVPRDLAARVDLVRKQTAAAVPSSTPPPAPDGEGVPGVRLVAVRVQDVELVFSLWSRHEDVVALTGDVEVPAGTELLAIDEQQVRAAARAGVIVDLSALAPCRSLPGLRYALLHYVGARQIRRVVRRMAAPAASAA